MPLDLNSNSMLVEAVAAVAEELTKAENVVFSAYSPIMNTMVFPDGKSDRAEVDELEDVVEYYIDSLTSRIALILEWIGLPESRVLMLKEISEVRKSSPVIGWWDGSQGEGPESKAINVLGKYAGFTRAPADRRSAEDGMRAMRDARRDAQRDAQLEFVETIMKSLPVTIKELSETPAKEHDVQAHLNRHLKAAFPSFVFNPSISKPIAKFVPDCGIIDLGLAIEVKFVDSAAEFKNAYRGITEDLSGYAGSKDWTRFYSYVYMTGAHGTSGSFTKGIGAHGTAGSWRTVVVTGPGQRKKKKK